MTGDQETGLGYGWTSVTGDQLTDLMKVEANKRTNRVIARLLKEGARWIADPQVTGVYGLKPASPLPGDKGHPERVVVIVYLNGVHPDFEVSESFEEVPE